MTVAQVEVDDFLAHFGVKGMQWGVRKDVLGVQTTRQASSSKELVKEAKAGYKNYSSEVIEYRFDQYFNNTKFDSTKLSTEGRTIDAGKEFYRLSKAKNTPLADTAYFSTNVADRSRYRGVLSNQTSFFISKKNYKSTYETTLKTAKKLTLPSEKERFDAFVELLDTRIITVGSGRFRKEISGREFLQNTAGARDLKKLDSIRAGEKYYIDFVAGQGGKSPMNSAYFELMKKKGFDAISDDNDRNIVSDDPLIVFDTKNSVRTISVKQLSNDDINNAMRDLSVPKGLNNLREDTVIRKPKPPKPKEGGK